MRLAGRQAEYDAVQAARVRLQEDITAMRNSYDVKLSTLEENLRKEKETGVCCREPPSVFPLSDMCVKRPLRGRLHPFPSSQAGTIVILPIGEKTGPERRAILPLATQLGK